MNKKGNIRYLLSGVLLVFAVLVAGYFFLIKPNSYNQISLPTSTNIIKGLTPTVTQPKAKSLDSNLILTSLLGDEVLKAGQQYVIDWKYTDYLTHWSEDIDICLIGYKGGKVIPAKADWNEQLCTYRDGDLVGSYLITTDKIADKNYKWTIPTDIGSRFTSLPENYKLRILVFHDQKTAPESTGWEGNVGNSESGNYFTIQ